MEVHVLNRMKEASRIDKSRKCFLAFFFLLDEAQKFRVPESYRAPATLVRVNILLTAYELFRATALCTLTALSKP